MAEQIARVMGIDLEDITAEQEFNTCSALKIAEREARYNRRHDTAINKKRDKRNKSLKTSKRALEHAMRFDASVYRERRQNVPVDDWDGTLDVPSATETWLEDFEREVEPLKAPLSDSVYVVTESFSDYEWPEDSHSYVNRFVGVFRSKKEAEYFVKKEIASCLKREAMYHPDYLPDYVVGEKYLKDPNGCEYHWDIKEERI